MSEIANVQHQVTLSGVSNNKVQTNKPVISNMPEIIPVEKIKISPELNKASKVVNYSLNLFEIEKTKQALQINRTFIADSGKKIIASGLIGVAIDGVFNISDYQNGEIDAKTYTGKTLGGFIGWSVFEAGVISVTTIGGKILGRKMSPLASTSVGVGFGIITHSLYDKAAGSRINKKLAEIIPENVAVDVADNISTYIGKPIEKYISEPVKNNPKTSIGVGLGLLTAATVKWPVKFGKNFLLGMTGATVIGGIGEVGLHKLFKKDTEPKTASNGTLTDFSETLNTLLPENQQISADDIWDLAHNPDFISKIKGQKKTNPLEIKLLSTPVSFDEFMTALDIQKRYHTDEQNISESEILFYDNVIKRKDNKTALLTPPTKEETDLANKLIEPYLSRIGTENIDILANEPEFLYSLNILNRYLNAHDSVQASLKNDQLLKEFQKKLESL